MRSDIADKQTKLWTSDNRTLCDTEGQTKALRTDRLIKRARSDPGH